MEGLVEQGNMSGAIEHYRAALELEPAYPEGNLHPSYTQRILGIHELLVAGLSQLRVPACYVKFHGLANRAEATGGDSCR